MIEGINTLNITMVKDNETKITISISEGYKAIVDRDNNEITILVTKGEKSDNPILKDKVIAIDPGHGGTDPGAVGPSGLMEKDINLSTSLMIRDLLQKLGAKVLLTRTSDVNVTLGERVRTANNGRAELFVSVHYNGFSDPNANGTETFWHTNGSPDSRRLANLLQQELLVKLNRRNRGVKQANFFVLRETRMAAALIEPLFITNPTEEMIIRDERNQLMVAEAVVDSIVKYFS